MKNWKWESYSDGSIGGTNGKEDLLINPHDYSMLLTLEETWKELKNEQNDIDNFDEFKIAYNQAIKNYKKNAGTYQAGTSEI